MRQSVKFTELNNTTKEKKSPIEFTFSDVVFSKGHGSGHVILLVTFK